MAQLVARRRLDHVRPAAEQLDPLTRLTRLLENAFQAVEGRRRCITLAVEQTAVGGHRRRKIAQGVFFQVRDS